MSSQWQHESTPRSRASLVVFCGAASAGTIAVVIIPTAAVAAVAAAGVKTL